MNQECTHCMAIHEYTVKNKKVWRSLDTHRKFLKHRLRGRRINLLCLKTQRYQMYHKIHLNLAGGPG